MSRIAVVFVSYLKVPESRLLAHFEWNREVYEACEDELRVYVVSDVEHPVPEYAEVVVFPMERLPKVKGQTRFSLTMTKNAGIRKAIEGGADVIICTDVDMQFSQRTFEAMLSVSQHEAVLPIYCMAPAAGEEGPQEPGCTGTVAMTADNWRRVQYDERCVGYGADDGILLRDIERARLVICRDCMATHVAHIDGDGARTPGSGAGTCWGRADGFNFDNFANNRQLHNKRLCRRRR